MQALVTNTFDLDLLEALGDLSLEDHTDQLENRLLNVIVSTFDPRLRNATAIALADLGSKIAPSVIRDLLTSAKTYGSRATLLYALRELLGHIPVEMAARLISNDNEETAEECINLLKIGLVDLGSSKGKMEALALLRAAFEDADDPSRRAILEEGSELIAQLSII